jgi:hypothetical protein
MSNGAIARAVRRRGLLRLYPGVYAVGHRVMPIEGRLFAALLYAGPAAALSHTTAAWWWRIVATEPRIVHLSAPVMRVPVSGLRLHYPRSVERTLHDRLAVTPVARMLLDLASVLAFDALRRAVQSRLWSALKCPLC